MWAWPLGCSETGIQLLGCDTTVGKGACGRGQSQGRCQQDGWGPVFQRQPVLGQL